MDWSSTLKGTSARGKATLRSQGSNPHAGRGLDENKDQSEDLAAFGCCGLLFPQNRGLGYHAQSGDKRAFSRRKSMPDFAGRKCHQGLHKNGLKRTSIKLNRRFFRKCSAKVQR
jgi:hypothetical protein